MYPEARHAVARTGIGAALWLGGLGLFITFVPGAEAEWFGAAAGLAALGLLSPNRRVRSVAVGLVVAWAWLAWVGYQRGLRYQEWLRTQGLA